MATDNYKSIITNIGESTVLQNVVNANVFKIVRIEFCSQYNLDLSDAFTWEKMPSVVYKITGEDSINRAVKKYQVDDNTIQFRITVGPEVGGSVSNAWIFGSVGVYLEGYDEEGNPVTTNPVLFMVGSFDTPFSKYAEGSGVSGNTVSVYLNVRVSNQAEIENIVVAPSEWFSIPTVETENSTYLKNNYNLYGIRNYDESEKASLAFKESDSTTNWSFFLSKDELPTRMSPSGVYTGVLDSVSFEYKGVYYTQPTTKSVVTHLSPDVVLSFCNGFNSDGTFRKIKQTVDTDVYSAEDNAVGNKYTIAYIDNEDGVLKLAIVLSSNVVFSTVQPEGTTLNPIYWCNRKDGLTYIVTESLEEVKWCVVAKYRINDDGLAKFHPVRPADFVDFILYDDLCDKLDTSSEYLEKKLRTLVHLGNGEDSEEEDNIYGRKTFTYNKDSDSTQTQYYKDALVQSPLMLKTPNPSVNLISTTSASYTSSINYLNKDSNVVATVLGTANSTNGGSLTLGVYDINGIQKLEQVYTNGNYLKINNSSTNTIETSADVQKGFTTLIGNYTGAVTINGDWTFSKQVTGTTFNGIALAATWADLAENYETDKEYPVGTLVKFGGEKEITIAKEPTDAEAVISSKPGFLLNNDCKGLKQAVALVGRVPVRIVGKVNKGDFIYMSPEQEGVAIANKCRFQDWKIIGKSLETNLDNNEKLVECVVRLNF